MCIELNNQQKAVGGTNPKAQNIGTWLPLIHTEYSLKYPYHIDIYSTIPFFADQKSSAELLDKFHQINKQQQVERGVSSLTENYKAMKI